MVEILNVKHVRSLDGKNVAYCGLSYSYWSTQWEIITEMVDLSVLGKPRRCIVKGDRDASIANYRKWLWSVIEKPEIVGALKRIGSGEFDAVACWCKPKACHCDVILSAADWIMRKE